MKPLRQLVREYLETEGFHTLEERDLYLILRRAVVGGVWDMRTLFVLPDDEPPLAYESRFRPHIEEVVRRYPTSRRSLITSTRAGFSRDFRSMLNEQQIQVQLTANFFELNFQWTQTRNAAGFAKRLADQGSAPRISQPFAHGLDTRLSAQPPPGEGDIIEHLVRDLATEEASRLHIVVAPAGMGKTVAASALYARLHDELMSGKRRGRIEPRPIFFGPDNARNLPAMRTELLIQNFLASDLATPVRPSTLEWLVVNRFSVWIFDGLDELYAGDPDFFDFLLDIVTRPGSQAQIVVFSRDSVVASSDVLSSVLALEGDDSTILHRLHLTRWTSKEVHALEELRAGSVTQSDIERYQPTGFASAVSSSLVLTQLAGIPFYAQLLFDLFQAKVSLDVVDEVHLLERTVVGMLDREQSKGLIDYKLFVPQGLEEWLELIASLHVETGYAGVSVAQCRDYAELVVADGVSSETEENLIASLLRAPFFNATEYGAVSFTHELLAEVLAARQYARRLARNPHSVAQSLAAHYDPGRLAFRAIARRMKGVERDAVVRELHAVENRDSERFAALLTLLLLFDPDHTVCQRFGLTFARANLRRISFEGRDLAGLSFAGADLTDVVFRDCDLSGANLSSALLCRTRFINTPLVGATIDDLASVTSVYVGQRLLESTKALLSWVQAATGCKEAPFEPCPTALQFLRLFGKFVDRHGQPRRDALRLRALLSGERVDGAADLRECVHTAARLGYLMEPDQRERCRRPRGDRYREIVEFVRDNRVSDGVGAILEDLCIRDGCLHQLNPNAAGSIRSSSASAALFLPNTAS